MGKFLESPVVNFSLSVLKSDRSEEKRDEAHRRFQRGKLK